MPVLLKLLGFSQDPSTPKTSGADKEYEVFVNPESIKHSKGMLFNSDNRANGSIDVQQWKGFSEEILDITLSLDGTAYATENKESVEEQIKKIMEVIYDYDGGVHKPLYTVINWGNYAFLGHVKNLETDYKFFNNEGSPLFATIHIEMTIHVDNETAAKKQNRNSPDMSHLQVMKDGDKIPLICNEIYDDPTYYVQIAELNGLTNFRNVSIGKKLLFPPLIHS